MYTKRGEEVSITVMGHKLGGALAILSAFGIAEMGANVGMGSQRVPISVYTFGGPHVENFRFKQRVEERHGVKTLRVVNVHDTVPKVFVVGHDWGANVSWHLCLFRPDKVKAVVNMSVFYLPRSPSIKPLDYFRDLYGDDYYIIKFQVDQAELRPYMCVIIHPMMGEPGIAETLFNRLGAEHVLKKFFAYHSTGPLYISKEFGDPAGAAVTLPSWFSQDDIKYYTRKYKKAGFSGGFNYYRCMNINWELTAPWNGMQIKVPAKFIVGDLDMAYHHQGIQDYINKGGLKQVVPSLHQRRTCYRHHKSYQEFLPEVLAWFGIIVISE